uniref:Uncharacterized protein n=1 Tax=Chenopodium quinoa TaxID=63459 RepID=A0A803LVG1_CHEQI
MQLKSLISSSYFPSNPFTFNSIPLYVKRDHSPSSLQYNKISGFPSSIYLSNNRFNGTIPSAIGRLKQLHVLDLSRNDITGNIPDKLSGLQNLEVLDLSFNDLQGSIPSSLNSLTFLSKFSVAHNHLQGEIPTGVQFQSFPTSSFEDNSNLCGSTQASPCTIADNVSGGQDVSSGSNNKFCLSCIFRMLSTAGNHDLLGRWP